MRLRYLIIAAAILLGAGTTAFAQLSMAKADWARGPVQFLMTPEEKTQWNAVKSDAEADAFAALFWARRDPTPGTAQNEFRDEFERRVQYADQNFASNRQRGSLTDRGKVLVVFGPPSKATRIRPAPAPGTAPDTLNRQNEAEEQGETQIWLYEGDAAQKMFGASRVEFRFVDRLNNRDFRLEPPRIDWPAAQQRMIASLVTQPNLTTIPTQQLKPPAAPQPVAPEAPVTTLKTAALETVITEAKASKPASKGALLSYAEFVAPTGEYYVPVGLYVPASAGLTTDATDTFFGVVEEATGKRVLAFEEPAKLTASKADLFADKTLTLPSGKYTAIVGLAKAGTPVLLVSAPLELNALGKDATGTSKLILSNNIYETPEAAPVKSPFAFGKLKIVPKADLVFSNKDELNYFVEIHNPGIAQEDEVVIETITKKTSDTTSVSQSKPVAVSSKGLPKLQMKLDLVDKNGKLVAGAPLSDAQALPLSGQPGPGQYAIISGIPLSQMSQPLAPGDYTLKMKIIDTVNKQSYTLEQKFKIVA